MDPSWVANEIVINTLILLISLIVLDTASHTTITNAVKTSEITGIRKTTIGFTLIAFLTSLPELSVAVISALTGAVGISIGNVLGSNIVNVCLIIGLGVLLATLKRSKPLEGTILSISKGDIESLYSGLFIASLIPLSLIYIAYVSQVVGFILLIIFAMYTYHLLKTKAPQEEKRENALWRRDQKVYRYVALTFAGVIGVVASSHFIVDSASKIAEIVGVPKSLIGATIIALGTSLPEFSLDVRAIIRGEPALAFGDIVGSCFVNITLILGVTLLGSPLKVDMRVFSDLVIFSLISNLFLWYFLTIERMGRREGTILLFIYFLFLATTFGVIRMGG